jgi:hypothetical protein
MKKNHVGWIVTLIVVLSLFAIDHVKLTKRLVKLEAEAAVVRLDNSRLKTKLYTASHSIDSANRMLAMRSPGADRYFVDPVDPW